MPKRTNTTQHVPSKANSGAVRALSTKQILLIIVPAVVVLTAAATIFAVSQLKGGKVENTHKPQDTRATVVSKENAQEVKEAIDTPVEDGSYQVSMNIKWIFDGTSSDAYVENYKDNTRTVYFDVFRSDTNELVYSSPYIPVGEKLKGFTLSSTLAPGDYKGLVTYHLVNDDHEEISNLSVNVNFQVK